MGAASATCAWITSRADAVLPSCNGGSTAWSGTITFRYDGMKQTSTSTDTDTATVYMLATNGT